jgi:hypothetical protein
MTRNQRIAFDRRHGILAPTGADICTFYHTEKHRVRLQKSTREVLDHGHTQNSTANSPLSWKTSIQPEKPFCNS